MDNPGGLMLGFGCLILATCMGIAIIISALNPKDRSK